ncbi:MAG: glycoside hydrolase domain-containing protein [Polyangiales bacterium]
MRRLAFLLPLLLLAKTAAAADLTVGAFTPNTKVREGDTPATKPSIALKAAKNEFEAFQIVLKAGAANVDAVSAKVSAPLTGPGGAKIPDANVVLYVERYYDVGTASNDEGAPGTWPDPLVPDVDTYLGEKRNAFPLSVPANKTRVIWVDVLVPQTQTAGDYTGEIEIDVAGAKQAAIAVNLHVGTFVLPSTATLASAFGMGWSAAPVAHCPGTSYPFCGDATGEASNKIRALYLRSALEHRFTVSDTDFQPPFGSDKALYEKYVLPLINGTAATRLPGAKLTAVRLDGGDGEVKQWIDYAKTSGFFDRLVYYPVDEPGTASSAWSKFKTSADALHAADANARILITSSIQDATSGSALDKIDIFVPVIDELENRPGSGTYAGDQRAKYDSWLSGKSNRAVWAYQSCDEHGCGSCGTKSPGVDYTGWPNRVIDSSAVQDRAFPWQAFRFRITGELYFETTYQLADAWKANGQCAFSGSGDGTIFYPGTKDQIGGTNGIPIESIRMKMIREGMEDYEYLVLASKKDAAKAKAIADGLFPHSYESAKSADALEKARGDLFAMLDEPGAPPGDSGVSDSGTTDSGVPVGDDAGVIDDGSTSDDGGIVNGDTPASDGGCGCRTTPQAGSLGWLAILGLGLLGRRRARS